MKPDHMTQESVRKVYLRKGCFLFINLFLYISLKKCKFEKIEIVNVVCCFLFFYYRFFIDFIFCLRLKGELAYNYKGPRTKDDIVEFANRVSGWVTVVNQQDDVKGTFFILSSFFLLHLFLCLYMRVKAFTSYFLKENVALKHLEKTDVCVCFWSSVYFSLWSFSLFFFSLREIWLRTTTGLISGQNYRSLSHH